MDTSDAKLYGELSIVLTVSTAEDVNQQMRKAAANQAIISHGCKPLHPATLEYDMQNVN